MNKLFLNVLAIAFFCVSFAVAKDSIYDAWQITEVTASSAVITSGASRVNKVWLSTTAEGGTVDQFAILVDSPALVQQPNRAFSGVVSARIKTPPLLFPTTEQVRNAGNPMIVFEAGDYGVLFTSGVVVFKSTGSNGLAQRAYIQWRQ